MKCLILCMCCNNPYFLKQWEDIKETWGSHILNGEYPDIDIIMYTSSGSDEYAYDKENHILYVAANDSLPGTFEKTKKAFQALNMFNVNYDCILRTNCSTIINLPLLNEFIHSDLYDLNKVYTSELYLGGWKTAPFDTCFTFRGNFMLLSKFYINLINDTSVEMVKQINDFYRYIHKDLFRADDITIASIINTYIEANGIDKRNIYQRMPIQYLSDIYEFKSKLFGNTMAFFIKKFGDKRQIEEYYNDNSFILRHFYENYYNLLSSNLEVLEDDLNTCRFIEKHVIIGDTQNANIYKIKYEALDRISDTDLLDPGNYIIDNEEIDQADEIKEDDEESINLGDIKF